MECGNLKGQPKEETIAMAYACYATVGKRVDYNTYGGNVKPATRTYNWLQLQEIKKDMNSEPQCLWTTGVITTDYTALPETEHMKAENISLNCTES
eukprot:4923083-Heterocapsa_arctica.AAC.1